jgi:hypothetical protein
VSILDGLMVAVALTAPLWWAFSRRRRAGSLEALSVGALALAVASLAVDGVQWQLVPWQVLALAVAAAAVVRRWRPVTPAGGAGVSGAVYSLACSR